MSSINRILASAAIIIASTLIAVGLVEGFLTYENYYPTVEKILIEIRGEKYPFLKPNPFNQIDNSKRNVIIIGDSFVEGVHCAAKSENLPSFLQKELGGDFAVINMGVGGKNPVDYIDWISEIPIKHDDIIIVVLYDNDVHLTELNCSKIKRQSTEMNLYVPTFCEDSAASFISKDRSSLVRKINYEIKSLKVVQLLKESIVNIPLFSGFFYRSDFQTRWNKFEAEETKWIISSIVAMKEQVESKGGTIHFSYYPNTNAISQHDPRHKIWKSFISQVSESVGIVIDDPYPYLIDQASDRSMVWSLTDKHPSCDAHLIVAKHMKNAFF